MQLPSSISLSSIVPWPPTSIAWSCLHHNRGCYCPHPTDSRFLSFPSLDAMAHHYCHSPAPVFNSLGSPSLHSLCLANLPTPPTSHALLLKSSPPPALHLHPGTVCGWGETTTMQRGLTLGLFASNELSALLTLLLHFLNPFTQLSSAPRLLIAPLTSMFAADDLVPYFTEEKFHLLSQHHLQPHLPLPSLLSLGTTVHAPFKD